MMYVFCFNDTVTAHARPNGDALAVRPRHADFDPSTMAPGEDAPTVHGYRLAFEGSKGEWRLEGSGRLVASSLTPMVGAEGGAGCPVVVQAEPGLVVGGSPARASLDGRKARLAEALDPDGEGLFTDDPRGQT